MQITDELITYLEKLGRISLTEEERASSKKDLQNILTYIDILNELDTDGAEPLSHSFPITNVLREDVVKNDNKRDEILTNAPNKADGCFRVPKTLE